MADTGNEHVETYDHIEEIKTLCDENDIEFWHLTPDLGYHSDNWISLEHFYASGDRIGSKAYPKTCTDRLKIQPIYRFLEDWLSMEYDTEVGRKKGIKQFAERYGKIDVIIGIAKGEERRLGKGDEGPKWMQQSINKVYPLVDLGLDRQGCQNLIRAYGQNVPVPSHCRFCPFKTDLEVFLMERDDAEGLARWMELESNKIAAWAHKPDDQNMGVFGKKRLPQVLEEARVKYADWTDEDLHEHRMTHGHCVKSAY